MWHWLDRIINANEADRKLITAIKTITGLYPHNLDVYKVATAHSSLINQKRGAHNSNERLEYLGDAILGAIIADYLFNKYPFEKEGFLTEIRSRIVNRETLNAIAVKVGIGAILKYDEKNCQLRRVILGNALEALVGAIYLDRGFRKTRKFIVTRLVLPYMDLKEIVEATNNYKSRLIEWVQARGHKIRFDLIDDSILENNIHEFKVVVYIDGTRYAEGIGSSKKRAEQNAAEKTCATLKINS